MAIDVAMKAAVLVKPIFVSTVSEKKTKKRKDMSNMKTSFISFHLMIFNVPIENVSKATHPRRRRFSHEVTQCFLGTINVSSVKLRNLPDKVDQK